MKTARQARASAAWPPPAEAGPAADLAREFAALGSGPARLAASAAGAALLAALGGNSPYLAGLALREPGIVLAFLRHGPEPVFARILARLGAVPRRAERALVAARLRAAKRQVALAVALADLGGLWPLERVTGVLSDFADRALALALGHLLGAAHRAGEIALPDPARPEERCAFTVLAMGKLGARELNYSSDIDLVLLYDPESSVYHGERVSALCNRLARDLVQLMSARDAEGYVFRIDLRLRPDPAATPLAVALPAALTYYESMGENWERAALLKARPAAGDRALGAAFLEAIRPFIWRRSLDFATIADIAAVKRRIDARGGAAPAAADPVARLAGHDLKLGRGGIREIEFLAQTLELVWGGRDPGLRSPATVPALRALARAGHLPRRASAELVAAYRFLRRAEHRLQMRADRQTHSLPASAEALARFAGFMGFPDPARFAAVLGCHLGRVERHYAALFAAVPTAPGGLDLGVETVPAATLAALAALGFAAPETVAAGLARWRAGRMRAFRAGRAREMLEALEPELLAAMARQPAPDAVFARFDAFLSALPAGVGLLSLFQRNPALIGRIADILGAAPALAEYLARNPAAIDGLLLGGEQRRAPGRALARRLADAPDLERAIGLVRGFVHDEEFQISALALAGRIDVDAAGRARSAIADAALAGLLGPVLADHAARYGRVPGGGMVVVALGKTGGREMMAGSDLDLMLVYDHPEAAGQSRGGRVLPASQYFLRLAHGFVGAITAPGAEGAAYAVDMRLRPSGNKGPVAVSLAAFRRYHAESAWTWERMALTRARVVAGPRALALRVAEAIAEALRAAGDPAAIRADAAAMRARLARDQPPRGPWDVKLCAGGLIEVEFIAQALQLVHAGTRPECLATNSAEALGRLAAGGLIAAQDSAELIAAGRLWRTILALLRLRLGAVPEGEPPEGLAAALAEAAGVLDAPRLRPTMEATAAQVRAAFIRHLGPPDLNEGDQK